MQLQMIHLKHDKEPQQDINDGRGRELKMMKTTGFIFENVVYYTYYMYIYNKLDQKPKMQLFAGFPGP